MANRGKRRQIEDVKRSKIVVEIGVFYYRCPFVTLSDLECRGFEAGQHAGRCRSGKLKVVLKITFQLSLVPY